MSSSARSPPKPLICVPIPISFLVVVPCRPAARTWRPKRPPSSARRRQSPSTLAPHRGARKTTAGPGVGRPRVPPQRGGKSSAIRSIFVRVADDFRPRCAPTLRGGRGPRPCPGTMAGGSRGRVTARSLIGSSPAPSHRASSGLRRRCAVRPGRRSPLPPRPGGSIFAGVRRHHLRIPGSLPSPGPSPPPRRFSSFWRWRCSVTVFLLVGLRLRRHEARAKAWAVGLSHRPGRPTARECETVQGNLTAL
jgi:hypothetical protein